MQSRNHVRDSRQSGLSVAPLAGPTEVMTAQSRVSVFSLGFPRRRERGSRNVYIRFDILRTPESIPALSGKETPNSFGNYRPSARSVR